MLQCLTNGHFHPELSESSCLFLFFIQHSTIWIGLHWRRFRLLRKVLLRSFRVEKLKKASKFDFFFLWMCIFLFSYPNCRCYHFPIRIWKQKADQIGLENDRKMWFIYISFDQMLFEFHCIPKRMLHPRKKKENGTKLKEKINNSICFTFGEWDETTKDEKQKENKNVCGKLICETKQEKNDKKEKKSRWQKIVYLHWEKKNSSMFHVGHEWRHVQMFIV